MALPIEGLVAAANDQQYFVSWDGPDDPENPQNWSSRKKWSAAWVVAVFSAIGPMSSSILAPSLHQISDDFNLGADSMSTQIAFSIYVLSWGIGPLVLGPLSEMYGRVSVLQISNVIFVGLTAASGASQSAAAFIALRFLSGLAGSAALAVDDGMLADMWLPDELGGVVGLYSIGPLLGPAIAPVIGGFITQYSEWRWSMYSIAIASAAAGFVGFFTLQEMYGPVLLKRKAHRIRKETSDPRYYVAQERADMSYGRALLGSLVRPIKMLFTQIIIQVLSLYIAYIFGILYLFLSTFTTLWVERYHESTSIASLNYLSLSLGLILGTQVGAMVNDKGYLWFKSRHGGLGVPEFRAPAMIVWSLVVPLGILCYGWSAQARVHWVVPNIGTAFFGFGGILCYQGIQAYVLEAYPSYAASAMAATTLSRSIASFVFPIFGPSLYHRLDYGWGNTLLAGIAVIVGIPAPIFLYLYGARLRAKSPYGTEQL